MKGSLTALVAVLFSMGSVAVFAQTPGSSSESGSYDRQPSQSSQSSQSSGKSGMSELQNKNFKELDTNGDGRLTMQEAEQHGIDAVTFESLDKQGKGEVTEKQFDDAKKQMGGSAR